MNTEKKSWHQAKHEAKIQEWREIVWECRHSGQRVGQWCKEHGISDKTFFYWQRKLREDAYISTIESSALPAVKDISAPTTSPIDFVEVKIPEQNAAVSTVFRPDIIIRKNSFSLEISNTVSPELLSMIGGLLHVE